MIRILHIDSDTEFVDHFTKTLQEQASQLGEQVTLEKSNDFEEGAHKLNSQNWDLILVDDLIQKKLFKTLDIINTQPVFVFGNCLTKLLQIKLRSQSDIFLKGQNQENIAKKIITQAKANQTPPLSNDYGPLQLAEKLAGQTLRSIRQRIKKYVNSPLPGILVLGESGTGKELIANFVEEHLEVGTPFIRINCASFTNGISASEFFGYEKGAFTGATQSKLGLLRAAHQGWVFFDEFATLNLEAQALLLRVLDCGEIRPVGSTKNHRIKVKILAATNEPIFEMAKRGQFRMDLLQRIEGTRIVIPPLRKRTISERLEIIKYLCKNLHSENENDFFTLSKEVEEFLLQYPWAQGNIRQLKNVLTYMATNTNESHFGLDLIPTHLIKDFIKLSKEQLLLSSEI